ncbi:hypothetical protein [Chitinophaga skermanii]|nr:hypothetical protein [Chitinophaga skermanii]
MTGISFTAKAQIIPASLLNHLNYLGFTITGSPSITFSTAAEYQNGKASATLITVGIPVGVAWQVQVRATTLSGPASNTIDITKVILKANLSGAANVPLSTTNVTLATGVISLLSSYTVSVTMQGGAHLLKPSGTYTSTLTFTYTGL